MHNGYEVQIIIEPVDDRFVMPEYAKEGDAGMDLRAYPVDDKGNHLEEVSLPPGKTMLISAGFKVGLPDGWYLTIVPRSGISLHTPLKVKNSPGTVDTNYKGVVGIIIENTSTPVAPLDIHYCDQKGQRQGTYIIRAGDRIAQMIPERRHKAQLVLGSASSVGEDRKSGFGETGI